MTALRHLLAVLTRAARRVDARMAAATNRRAVPLGHMHHRWVDGHLEQTRRTR